MVIEEGIQCPECRRAVVPRLWFTGEKNPIAYRKTQHICPYCGVIMYQTGGGVNWTALVILTIVFGACALVILTLITSRRGAFKEHTQNFAKAIYHDFYIYKLTGDKDKTEPTGEKSSNDESESDGDDEDK